MDEDSNKTEKDSVGASSISLADIGCKANRLEVTHYLLDNLPEHSIIDYLTPFLSILLEFPGPRTSSRSNFCFYQFSPTCQDCETQGWLHIQQPSKGSGMGGPASDIRNEVSEYDNPF